MQNRLALFVFLGTVSSAAAQQQSWSPLVDFGATGEFVQGSPLEPRVVQLGFLGEWSYADGRFEQRRETLPSELAYLQAAAYDPTGHRSVAYNAAFFGLGSRGSSSIGVFDGARWEVVATPAVGARQAPAFGHDPVGGGLVMFGGMQPTFGPGTPLADTWRLVDTTWTQLAPTNAPSARSSSAVAVEPNSGRLVLFGGRTQQVGGSFLADTWQWTGSDWTQIVTANAPSARAGHALAADPINGGLILYGGFVTPFGTAVPFGDAWRFDGTNWSPLPAPLGGTPLTSPDFANVNGDLVLFGRTGATPGVVHGLRWTGSGWDEIYTSAQIETLFFSSYALDTVRNEVVRFGGRNFDVGTGPYQNETWIFDGAWQQRFPANSPPVRSYARSTFDPVNGEVVLFGGSDGVNFLGDTWTWDGVDWQQHFPTNSPPAQYQATLVFDPSRNAVVLHGGVGTSMSTWTWDGSDWTQIPTTSQTPALLGSLAFDAANNVLCFYANNGSVGASTLWELQGNAWVQVDATAPAFGNLTYDPVAGNLVLFALNLRYDFVGGTWIASSQPGIERDYVYDPARGGLLALSTQVALSTPTPAQIEPYGTGCGVGVTATLSFDRLPKLGADMDAVVRAGVPGSLVYVFFGFSPASNPFAGCTSWISNVFLDRSTIADASGFASIDSGVPAVPALAGINVYAQAFVAYPAPLLGQFGLSNGLRLQLGL
jgi:hypothetical protein